MISKGTSNSSALAKETESNQKSPKKNLKKILPPKQFVIDDHPNMECNANTKLSTFHSAFMMLANKRGLDNGRKNFALLLSKVPLCNEGSNGTS